MENVFVFKSTSVLPPEIHYCRLWESLSRQAAKKVFSVLLKHWLCRMREAWLAEQITKGKLWSALLSPAKQIIRPILHSWARQVSVSSMAPIGDASPALLVTGFVLVSLTSAEGRACAASPASLLHSEGGITQGTPPECLKSTEIIASANAQNEQYPKPTRTDREYREK